jgi:hypothetical protein
MLLILLIQLLFKEINQAEPNCSSPFPVPYCNIFPPFGLHPSIWIGLSAMSALVSMVSKSRSGSNTQGHEQGPRIKKSGCMHVQFQLPRLSRDNKEIVYATIANHSIVIYHSQKGSLFPSLSMATADKES